MYSLKKEVRGLKTWGKEIRQEAIIIVNMIVEKVWTNMIEMEKHNGINEILLKQNWNTLSPGSKETDCKKIHRTMRSAYLSFEMRICLVMKS